MERTDRWGRIYRRRQAEYVTAIPSLLDYFGFVYHFPGLLGGPNTYYREYHDVMSNVRYPSGKLPSSRYRAVLVNLAKGCLFFALFVVGSLYLPADFLLTASFAEKSLVHRVLRLYLTFLGVRCRYFGLWKLGESLCILDGFGEETNDGVSQWTGISNIDIWAFETSSSMSAATRAWNKRTQKWLQMCVYERSNFNQFYVFMVSAFWHGFYPSYYLCFGLGSLLQYANRLTAVKLWPRVQGTWMETPYLVLGNVCVMLVGSYMLEAMFNYSFERAWLGWKQASFFGIVFLFCGVVLLWLIPKVGKVDKTKRDSIVCYKHVKETDPHAPSSTRPPTPPASRTPVAPLSPPSSPRPPAFLHWLH